MSRTLALVVALAALAGSVATYALTHAGGSDPASPATVTMQAGPPEPPATTVTRRTKSTQAGAPPRIPAYKLARMRRGKSVAVHTAPGGPVARRLGPWSKFGSPRAFWVQSVQGPWLGIEAPELGNNRIGWVRDDPHALRLAKTGYSLHVDLSDRLIQLRLGGRTVRRIVVSVGRIGAQTPVGRFAVTDRIANGLPQVYGCCAIALSARQPSLPAGWIGGDRIAIHGWNGSVGDAASGGCLRAGRADMLALMKRLPLGTPVFIRA